MYILFHIIVTDNYYLGSALPMYLPVNSIQRRLKEEILVSSTIITQSNNIYHQNNKCE